MSAPAAPLPLSDGERETLERLARAQSAPHRQVVQARVLLLAADGVANAVIAEEVGVTPVTVRSWRKRFGEDGLAGLEKIRDGRGRKPLIPEETIARIVELTTTTTPPGVTHWSCRTMAKRVGVSPATVQRIWSDLGLAPHRVDTFKVSTDPKFEDK
ncbi:MAG: helix-turn-helix domain-containing protein, partial [Mycobacterium sp.]